MLLPPSASLTVDSSVHLVCDFHFRVVLVLVILIHSSIHSLTRVFSLPLSRAVMAVAAIPIAASASRRKRGNERTRRALCRASEREKRAAYRRHHSSAGTSSSSSSRRSSCSNSVAISRRRHRAPSATSIASNPLGVGWTPTLLNALSKSPADTVQAFLSIVLLFSLRNILPRVLRLIVVTSAALVTSSTSGAAASVDEAVHAWESSHWKWAVLNVYPVLSVALVVDIVGRVAAIIAANTPNPWAVFVVDNIARCGFGKSNGQCSFT